MTDPHETPLRLPANTAPAADEPIGFVGPGNMGLPMVRRLLDAGRDVIVYDIDDRARTAAEAAGAQLATSGQDVADHAGIVLLSLPTPAIVHHAVLGPDGVARGHLVSVIVELSTSGVPATTALAADLTDRGIDLVDSPVSGGTAGAAAGTLALMMACSDERFAAISPLLAPLGRVFHVGDSPGKGQAMKLLNNYLSAVALTATSEAAVWGVKAGLDPRVMMDVLNVSTGRNSATADKFPRAVLPGTFDAGFAIGLMNKDLRLFTDQADAMGVPLWVGSAIRHMWQFAETSLGAGADFTSIIKPLEDWTGVTVRAATSTTD